jgi:rhodanese-related sulfurtransferase
MSSLASISPEKLSRLVGTPRCPLLIDVRIQEDFAAGPRLIPGSLRRSHESVDTWGAALDGRNAVVICQQGRKLSEGVAAWLRHAGVAAEILDGGFAAWTEAGLPTVTDAVIPPRDAQGRTVWVTRGRPKIDRLACPWLIRRFVDPVARILFVAAEHVLAAADELSAIPFDVPDTDFSHEGERCSFDAFIARFGLSHAPLDAVADIVRGADTGRFELAPQAAGLAALSFGLSALHDSDEAAVEAGVTVYDALYAWAARARAETHGWPPAGLAA